MSKFLKISFPQKCIGCELCVLEVQRQFEKIGLEGSLIRVFKSKKQDSDFLKFSIDLDPRINKMDIEKIKEICPTLVFEVLDEEQDGLIK